MKKLLKLIVKKLILFVTLPIWLPIAAFWDDFAFWMFDKGWFE
jgi:hypothetical protein